MLPIMNMINSLAVQIETQMLSLNEKTIKAVDLMREIITMQNTN